jgi:alpha-N-arabinofuranosidase
LRGSKITLNDIDSPTFLGRRQEHFKANVKTCIDFYPSSQNEEAGLTVFLANTHHYDFIIAKRNNKRCIILRKHIDDMVTETVPYFIKDGAIILNIRSDSKKYYFSYITDDGMMLEIGSAYAKYLATELVGGWTGTYFGMFSSGNDEDCKETAYFNWFSYEGNE